MTPRAEPEPRTPVPKFATGDGATAAVEALAETWCYLNNHPHTATVPACAFSRRIADQTLVLLALNRSRSLDVGEYLMDRAVQSITAAIAKAAI